MEMRRKQGANKVHFAFADAKITLSSRSQIKQVISQMFEEHSKELESLLYVFCSDEYLLNLNQQFLKHETYTDIITFNLSEVKQPVTGEVYVSVDRVRENATLFNTSTRNEVQRVILHGALHLCGYKDKTKQQKEAMREKENFYLSRLL